MIMLHWDSEVAIAYGGGCYSPSKRTIEINTKNLNGCHPYMTVLHELGHAMGPYKDMKYEWGMPRRDKLLNEADAWRFVRKRLGRPFNPCEKREVRMSMMSYAKRVAFMSLPPNVCTCPKEDL